MVRQHVRDYRMSKAFLYCQMWAFLACLVAGQVSAEGLEPRVSVRPSLGPPASTVRLRGAGFIGSSCGVNFYLESIEGPLLGSAEIAGASFSSRITIPAGTTPGPHTVIVQGLTGSNCQPSGEEARTTFTLVDRSGPSERVVLEFARREIGILSRSTAGALLPPSDDLPEGKPRVSGFWYELQSADGAVLYRRIITDPIRLVSERPEIGSGHSKPDRKESVPQERVFTLLIPRPVEGDQLVIFSSPLEIGAQAKPAHEVARIRL